MPRKRTTPLPARPARLTEADLDWDTCPMGVVNAQPHDMIEFRPDCGVQLVLGGASWSTCENPAGHDGFHDGPHPTAKRGFVSWTGGEPTPCVVQAEVVIEAREVPNHTTLHTAAECSRERGCIL